MHFQEWQLHQASTAQKEEDEEPQPRSSWPTPCFCLHPKRDVKCDVKWFSFTFDQRSGLDAQKSEFSGPKTFGFTTGFTPHMSLSYCFQTSKLEQELDGIREWWPFNDLLNAKRAAYPATGAVVRRPWHRFKRAFRRISDWQLAVGSKDGSKACLEASHR